MCASQKSLRPSLPQTDQNTCDEFGDVVADLFSCNLCDISAKQARERHCKEDAEYFKEDITHEDTARGFALKICFSMFFLKMEAMTTARLMRRKMTAIACMVVGNCHRTTKRAKHEIGFIYFLR